MDKNRKYEWTDTPMDEKAKRKKVQCVYRHRDGWTDKLTDGKTDSFDGQRNKLTERHITADT